MVIVRSLFSITALLTALQLATAHDHNGIQKRHQGLVYSSAHRLNSSLDKRAEFTNCKFTYYIAGENACGTYDHDSDFIVAMNPMQFQDKGRCYQTITISLNGKTTQAKVTDVCSICPYGGLDLSGGLFSFFDSNYVDTGTVYDGEWSWGSDGSAEAADTKSTSTKAQSKPTSTKSTTTKASTTSHKISSTTSQSTTSSVTSSKTSETGTSSSTTSTAVVPSATQPTVNTLDQMTNVLIGIAGLAVSAASQPALNLSDSA